MMPPSFTVRHASGYLELRLPNFFEKAPLKDIHAIMKLLKKNPLLNETAHETLEKFFPVWEVSLRYGFKHEETNHAVKRANDVLGRSKRLERYFKVIDAYKTTKAQKSKE